MSKIIRGATLFHQPVEIKITLPCKMEKPAIKAISEQDTGVSEVEISEEAQSAIAEYLEQSKAEAQTIIEQAQAEAQVAIAQAQTEAQTITSEAQQAAEQLKDEAMQQGKELGVQQGREEGHQEVAALLAQAAKIVDYAKQEREAILASCENDILDLAISVAAKVIHTEIMINPEIVAAVVKDAIEKAKDQERVIIRINPADFETIVAEKQALYAILRRETGMELRADIGVETGGCVIETDYGAIDARIDTQLESVKNALRGVLNDV